MMSYQVENDHMKEILLLESTCGVKAERCEDDDFVDDKVHVFPTAVSVDNVELKDDTWQLNNMMQYEVSTSVVNIKTELSRSDECHMINDNIKMEKEGINDDDIKIEFDNGLLYCENCHAYYKDYCIKCGMLVNILNKNIFHDEDKKVQLQLPSDILEIRESSGQLGIFALKVIPEGVKFGPFTGLSGSECPLQIKGGKFVVNKHISKHLNWMQYINPTRNTSERNLLVLQCENNIYYRSTRKILVGDELLVYFGEDKQDSLNGDSEINFIPIKQPIPKDTFACTYCCLGFSSKSYLAKHKSTCSAPISEDLSIRELMQCPSCKIHLDRNEYNQHYMAYCWERKLLPPTSGDQTVNVNGRKTRRVRFYKCQQCKYTTKYQGDLNRHANQHNEVKTYKCGSCNRRFKTKGSLRLHEENAHAYVGVRKDPERFISDYNSRIEAEALCSPVDVKQFKCDVEAEYLRERIKVKRRQEFDYECDTCNYRTNRRANLKIHVRTLHLKEYDFGCDMCTYKTNRKSDLERHVKTQHLKEFVYNCDLCEYKINDRSKLEAHRKTKHLKEFSYKCESCAYKTCVKSNLEEHIKVKHLEEFDYKCDACEFKTNRNDRLQNHVNSKHLKRFDSKCDICSYETIRKSDLKRHIKAKHLKEYSYKCEICSYETNKKIDLGRHVKTKHLKVFDYKCDLCDYQVNDRLKFESHIKTKHLKEFDYKCQSCTFKTNVKSLLVEHGKTKHLNEFNYTCDLCAYKTIRKLHLEKHVRAKHLKESDYKCEMCDFKTKEKLDLERHAKMKHLKEFEYKCDSCAYKTNRKFDLGMHVKTKHLKEFDYKCDLCGYKTNNKHNLQGHLRRRHL